MSFSATEAAFEGFRIVRRTPSAVLFWSLAYLAAMAAFFLIGGPSIVNLMGAMEGLEQTANPGLSDFEVVGQIYAGILWWAVPLALLLSAVLSTAVARAVLRPEARAWGFMRVGADEARVIGATILVGLLMAVVYLVGGGAAFAIGAAATATGQAVLFLVALIVGLAAALAMIWLSIRLCLVVPATFDLKRLAFKEAWAASRGRFWPLLGMAVIALVMSIVVSILGGIVGLPLTLATGGLQSLARLEGSSLPEIISLAWPAILAWSVVNAVLSSLQMAVLYAPFAAAWQDIRSRQD